MTTRWCSHTRPTSRSAGRRPSPPTSGAGTSRRSSSNDPGCCDVAETFTDLVYPATDGFHGDTSNCPVEVAETRYRLYVDRLALNDEPGGEGEFRGRKRIVLEYRVRSDDCFFTCADTRNKDPENGFVTEERAREVFGVELSLSRPARG